ncbi:MAG: bifunctional hydroxymethylpyrimidine kinase/phosphomethylpyrimidine kinase [Hyphomicrobiales bacterium]|nr:bifunctional hydroxymethylpyrimidine kinase/phosphomethylpyrimidine kinase [Hyphomicrobiales bacterium]MCP5371690.1 bifunctional hydroxymethylpyrimidine kinase/phosphomethylpyrimidine kinase [Hyphomicrobiales bacterium]
MKGRVLIVAGSDSGGGAGIQADIKTVTALGGFAMTAITALTAQNTLGVTAIHEVPPDFVAEQMRVVLRDLGADAVKLGMLHSPQIIDVVRETLDAEAPDVPLVVDPVMVAKGGAKLLRDDAMAALKEKMIPGAAVITPNLPEAEVLCGQTADDRESFRRLGTALTRLGAGAVLLKGGHLPGDTVVDLLLAGEGPPLVFEDTRIESRHTHGTGCTLASAVATGIAQGIPLRQAVTRARAYVRQAMMTAPGLGQGHGPLNHAHTVRPFGG